jgi:hypothetical protein
MLGFGVPKDDAKSESLLNQSMRQRRDLDYKIDQIKQDEPSPDFQEGTYRRLEAEGYITRVEFAQYHREKQRLDKIELEYRREILDIESVLGAEHSIVQYLKSLLSSILESHGRWMEVEELRVQVMEMRKRALGAEHPDTLTSIANLASTLREQGRWKEAEELQVQVAETRKRVLGAEHLETLISIANLAATLQMQGRWREAEELQMQVVEARTRVLGAEHPDTLISVANLALIYRSQRQ